MGKDKKFSYADQELQVYDFRPLAHQTEQPISFSNLITDDSEITDENMIMADEYDDV